MDKLAFLDIARRDFLKLCGAAATATVFESVLPGCSGAGPMNSSALPGAVSCITRTHRPLGMVRPIIGTGWHGHTYPGATLPFGLVQVSPDTAGPPEADWAGNGMNCYGWDHDSGYHYPDNAVLGFSHTHLQGTGAVDLGDVRLMPVVEGANWGWLPGKPGGEHEAQLEALGPQTGWVSNRGSHGYASRFSHQHEVVRAGYYSVYLQTPCVKAELTATTRCGMQRYSYPSSPKDVRQGVLLNLVHGLGRQVKVYDAELTVESPTRISGKRCTHGWAKDRQVYFVMEFSRPVVSMDVNVDGNISAASSVRRISAKDIKAILCFAASSEPLVIRVGISGTGVAGAKKNLALEIPHWDFDAVHQQAEQTWNEALGALEVKASDAALAQCVYTGAYHGMTAPATFNDVDGTYRGQDHKNHPNPGFTNYTTLSIWDIYRAQFPFMMLMQPQRTDDVINTLLVDYQQLRQHSLPIWPLWGNETWCMTGFHVVGMIVGAYTRGFRGYDVNAVYAAMRDTAMVGSTLNNNKQLQEQFRHFGFVPTGPNKQSVSVTLDFSYDYWCMGAMAELLGKHDDARMFYKLSKNYKNLFDPVTGFMRGKTAAGIWRQPFVPDRQYHADYTEADAWQATFNVMQDVQGLIELFGGDEHFIAKLDALFTAPSKVYNSQPDISGLVGQDAQGNEPSNHIPYLYPFAGAAWKTQYWVRRVAALYNNTPAGIPGNDDCGQLSSWFVLTALGFYPVNAATGVYVIGSPLINRAKIHNPATGTTFTIIAENNSADNCYIQSANLNGRELTRSWFMHADIVAGGELHFRMGRQPNKDWATAKTDRPPSGLVSVS